ncbi:hypothetical protein SEPCBS57363_005602 [Sporothrix epigloea]|uniref:Uncharacterized protein n=1 Tax=Sporothrix epigloea TaxID=1892477 RepID=A0ABP0DYG9_9PEZI
MIIEWNRTFKDSNFGKSQYQWLKSRYGMKVEWGASLNHPPYAGARPGGPGTENWVPPEIPINPPRATFRTRSDSPAPVLITGPATAATQDPKFHTPAAQAQSYCHSIVGSSYVANCDPGVGQIRRSSAGAAYIAGKEYSSATANTSGSTTLSTPVMTPTMPITGSGTYVFSNNFNRNIERATSRSFSGSMNSSRGTYSFPGNLGPMSLASPFMPSTASVGVPNHMNPIVSSFAAGHGSSMPNLNGSYPMAANSRGVNTNSPRQPDISPMPAFSYGGSTHQAYQHCDLAGTSNTTQNVALDATKEGFQFEGGLAGLGIDHGANFLPVNSSGFFAGFIPSMSSPAQMNVSTPSGKLSSGSQSDSSDKINAFVQSSAEIIANVARDSSPICSVADATASPRLTQAGAGSKRKRNTVEVSFQPPKRAIMASSTDQAGVSFNVFAASELPSAADNSKGNPETYGSLNVSSSQASVLSSAVPTPSATPYLAPCFPVGHPSTLPFTEQIQEQLYSTIEVAGTWFHGMHRGCSIDARHCHGNSGGIFFLQTADFERAALSHNSQKNKYCGQDTSGSPAIGPIASTAPVGCSPVTAEIQVNAPFDLAPTSPSAGSDQVSGAKDRIGTPVQGATVHASERALTPQPHGAVDDHSVFVQRSAAAAANLEDYEFKLLYHVGASLDQSQINANNDAQSSTLAPISEAPATTEMDASLAPNTNLCTPVAEVADDFSSMANFEEDFDLNHSTIDVFSESDEYSSSLEASK